MSYLDVEEGFCPIMSHFCTKRRLILALATPLPKTNWFSIMFFVIFCNFPRSMASSPGPPPPSLTPSLWHRPLRMSPSPTGLGCPSPSPGMGRRPSPWPQAWPLVFVPPVGISTGAPEMTWSFQMDVMPGVLEKWWTCGNPGILLDGE